MRLAIKAFSSEGLYYFCGIIPRSQSGSGAMLPPEYFRRRARRCSRGRVAAVMVMPVSWGITKGVCHFQNAADEGSDLRGFLMGRELMRIGLAAWLLLLVCMPRGDGGYDFRRRRSRPPQFQERIFSMPGCAPIGARGWRWILRKRRTFSSKPQRRATSTQSFILQVSMLPAIRLRRPTKAKAA